MRAAWVPRFLVLHGWLEAGVHILEEAAQQHTQQALVGEQVEHWCPMCRNSIRLDMSLGRFNSKMMSKASLYLTRWNSKAPADGIIVEATWVVCCMLLQGKLPELAANLVATLSNLDGDELAWHASLARCSLHPSSPWK